MSYTLSGMESREGDWEPVLESQPSENFICAYEGPFAQQLELNRGVIDNFLELAALDGRVLVKQSTRRKYQIIPDLNPDGSVTAKSVLRWGEQPIIEEKRDNVYFQVEPDQAGWVISLNGGLIRDDLIEKKGIGFRGVQGNGAGKLNYYLRIGLKEVLLKEKCTATRDPYFYQRSVWSITMLVAYGSFIKSPDNDPFVMNAALAFFVSTSLNGLNYYFPNRYKNRMYRQVLEKIWDHPERKTVKNPLEVFGLSVEVDRLALAYGYLDYQMLKRNPLLRLTH